MTTVGIEEEFHLVDRRSRRLAPQAPAVLARLPSRGFTPEAKQCSVETNSEPHEDLALLREDLARSRRALLAATVPYGLGVVASGTMPGMALEDAPLMPGERYRVLDDEFAQVFHEQVICGLHVHVAAPDRDVAAASLAWITPWTPALLALTAGSPYWLGDDTGYASWRTMMWQRWPTAGPAPRCRSAAEYDAVVGGIVDAGVATDLRMIYHDVRLSSHLPTIELRVCDAVPDIDTAVAVAGLFRALVTYAGKAVRGGRTAPDAPDPWLRAATWRAARSGLEGELLDPESMHPVPAADVVRRLVASVARELHEAGDLTRVLRATETLIERGTWARRQRRTGHGHGVGAVVDLLVAETAAGGGNGEAAGAGDTPAALAGL